MAYAVSQGITLTLGGAAVPSVTQVTVSENAPNVDTSHLGLANGAYRTFIAGLKDAAEVTMNHIGDPISVGDKVGGLTAGSISFAGATVMSSEVAYRVGELVAYTTTIRASN
jgi:hypothetical protein